MNKKKGLGRGLAALIEDTRPVDADAPASTRPAPERMLPIDQLRGNPDQPRRRFDHEEMAALIASVKAKGIIQPIIVRPDPDPERAGKYQIVAGERRWRAAQSAGLHEAPVVVRALSDVETLELALIENVQRADLNPVEEGASYKKLMDQFGHSHAEIADALGKSRSHVANMVRLVQLPEEVRMLLRDRLLSAGHARALLSAPDPVRLAKKAAAEGLTVRQTEQLARQAQKAPEPERAPSVRAHRAEKDPDTVALEQEMAALLGMKIDIRHAGSRGGELRIRYRTLEQLDLLVEMLNSEVNVDIAKAGLGQEEA